MKPLLFCLFISFTMCGQEYKFNLAKEFEVKNKSITFSRIVFVNTKNQSYFLYLVPLQEIAILYDFDRKVSLLYDLESGKDGFQQLVYTKTQSLPVPSKRKDQNIVEIVENDSLTSTMEIKFRTTNRLVKPGEKLIFKTYMPFSLADAQNLWIYWSDQFKNWDLPFEPVIESWIHYSSEGNELSSKRLVSAEPIDFTIAKGNRSYNSR